VRGWRRLIVFVLIALESNTASAQTPAAATSPNPRIDAQARAIPHAEVSQLQEGVFRAVASGQLSNDIVPPEQMPANDPYWHYAGKGPDGKYHVWLNAHPPSFSGALNAFSAGMPLSVPSYLIMFAADSGSAGPVWKARYDAASDKQEFVRVAQRAIELIHDQDVATGAAHLTFLRALKVGTTRTSVYGALKQRKMIAYNNIYNPGKPLENVNGCDYGSTRSQSYWPVLDQPLPTDGCKGPSSLRSRMPALTKSPSAFVDVTTDYDAGCGTTVQVRLDFSDDDKLSKVDESPPQQTCL
jgi:hypothetical protein